MGSKSEKKTAGGSETGKKGKIIRYTFRLNETENTRFLELMSKAGARNKSEFIASRIFAKTFRVVTYDAGDREFYARLNDLYYQFIRIGNNYNQIVRQVNTHFVEERISGQLQELVGYTRQLYILSRRIMALALEHRKKEEAGEEKEAGKGGDRR